MVATVNDILTSSYPVPGLTQDDSAVPYCNADNLPPDCRGGSVCHCPHLVQLELCKTYEFLIETGGGSEFTE